MFHRDIYVGEIGEVLEEKIDPSQHMSSDGITVFESLGVALEDLTAAKAIMEGKHWAIDPFNYNCTYLWPL